MTRERGKKQIGLGDLPKEVRGPLIRLMNEMHIDDAEAGLVKMAILADTGSKEFRSLVAQKSERKYTSRHFEEMNKTAATLKKSAEAHALSEYNRGWAECYKKHAINFPCVICGGLIHITPNSEPHRVIISYLREARWGHSECVKR
jgi:hypothetical protein